MPRKRTPWWLPDAIRLTADGRTSRELADLFKKTARTGQKPPGQSTIFEKVRAANGIIPPRQSAQPPPTATPPPEPAPLDMRPMNPDDVAGILTGLLRSQTALAQQLTAEGDHIGAQKATRAATTIAGLLQKRQALDDDGDVLRVGLADVVKAAESARSKLQDLVARLAAEGNR